MNAGCRSLLLVADRVDTADMGRVRLAVEGRDLGVSLIDRPSMRRVADLIRIEETPFAPELVRD